MTVPFIRIGIDPSANTAAAHKLARMVYFMLTRGEEFADQGQEKYEQQQRKHSVAALKRRAAALGFVIAPTASAIGSLFQYTLFARGVWDQIAPISESHYAAKTPTRSIDLTLIGWPFASEPRKVSTSCT